MKTLIISDIHANMIALEAVWKQENDADRIVCAGDLVDYGPHPVEVIEWMMDRQVTVVRGNHDQLVLDAAEGSLQDEEKTWRMHNASLLSPVHIDYLNQLPMERVLEIDGESYGLAHSYLTDYEIIRSVEVFEQQARDRFRNPDLKHMIFGHTHRRELHCLSDTQSWLNPGSISYRRCDETWRGAHYAVIQDGLIKLRSAEYAVDILYERLLSLNLVAHQKQPAFTWWMPELVASTSPGNRGMLTPTT